MDTSDRLERAKERLRSQATYVCRGWDAALTELIRAARADVRLRETAPQKQTEGATPITAGKRGKRAK